MPPRLTPFIAISVPQTKLSPSTLPDRSIRFPVIISCQAPKYPVFKPPSWEECDPLSDSALTQKISLEIYTGLRIVRDIDGSGRGTLLACWIELWRGAVASHRQFMEVDAKAEGDALLWTIRPA